MNSTKHVTFAVAEGILLCCVILLPVKMWYLFLHKCIPNDKMFFPILGVQPGRKPVILKARPYGKTVT